MADDLAVWRDAESDLAALQKPANAEIADLLRKQHEAILEFGRDDGPICYEIYG